MSFSSPQPYPSNLRGAVGWFFLGVIACVLFSLLFHKVWFVWLSWEVLHIPMGLGGAIYYIFFIGPVLVGSLLYQAAAQVILFRAKAPLRYRFVISFLVPFAVIAGLLIMNCPMEGEQSYTRAFLSTLFGRSRP